MYYIICQLNLKTKKKIALVETGIWGKRESLILGETGAARSDR